MKIVLFDIDGTLLHTHGSGRRAMERAMQESFGYSGIDGYHYDGKTDPQIVHEQMEAAGVHPSTIDSKMERLFEMYLKYLEQELVFHRHESVLCEGVVPLLNTLREREDVTLGLLTGNIRDGAKQKLEALGLNFEQFVVGAFGSDHRHRPELPAVARRRAEEYLGSSIAGEQLVIIGDTPADIHCGRSLGVRAIAVATGRYSSEVLASHSPALVLDSLADTARVVSEIVA